MANPKFKMMAIVLDCPDPHALADFYSALLGWEKKGEQSQLIHIDYLVDDIKIAVSHALELGATVAPWQPNGWPSGCGIMLDPVGHPFCLATIE